MAEARAEVEVIKLAGHLGIATEELRFLAAHDAGEVRELREAVSRALQHRNEDRVTRLAALTPVLPTAITAKIAEHALGPLLSARIAGAIGPEEAARLAGRLSPAFLAEVAVRLDPHGAKGLLQRLPADLLVDVGRRLLAGREHVALSRLVAVVDVAVAVAVMDGSSGADLLKVALYTEDPDALAAVFAALADESLAGMLRAAATQGVYDDAVTLLVASGEPRVRAVVDLHASSSDPQG